MNGWIKLHRDIMEKPIWNNSTPEQKVILVTVMMMVNHSGKEWEWKGQKFRCESGQVVTSLEKIAEKSGKGITTQNVRTALKRFEKLEFLTNESTKTGRLITVVNWRVYQGEEDESNKATNKDLTKTSQRPNKDLTTNKNDNNNKNDKKIYIINPISELVKLTQEEYDKLYGQYDKEYLDSKVLSLDGYLIQNPRKYKNHYMTLLNWIRRDGDKARVKHKEISTTVITCAEPPAQFKDW